jgi:hypothetical protein
MTTKTGAKNRILDAVHETARDLHTAGFIDKRRMLEARRQARPKAKGAA